MQGRNIKIEKEDDGPINYLEGLGMVGFSTKTIRFY